MRRYVHHLSRAQLDATAAQMRATYSDHRHVAALAAWRKRRQNKVSGSCSGASLPPPTHRSGPASGAGTPEACDRVAGRWSAKAGLLSATEKPGSVSPDARRQT